MDMDIFIDVLMFLNVNLPDFFLPTELRGEAVSIAWVSQRKTKIKKMRGRKRALLIIMLLVCSGNSAVLLLCLLI